jgi:hypothetical protein
MMLRRTSLYWFVGVTAVVTATAAGCASSSGGGRGTGGASGSTGNNTAGNNGTGGAHTGGGGTTNHGGSANNAGGPSMADLANMVKQPMGVMTTGLPDGIATSTDAEQAGTGELLVDTLQPGDTGDSVWVSEEDIDGDGVLDEVTTLVDDETGDKYTWYDTVIAGFCADGSDANATVVLAYTAETDSWTMMWDSDCPEDEGLIYACGLDADGNATECGVCEVDAATGTVLNCQGVGSTGGDEPPAPDAGGGEPPIIVENPYACQCAYDCDGFQDVTNVGGYCAESLAGAEVAVQADCEGLFLPDECATLVCDCACEATVEFSCEATAF